MSSRPTILLLGATGQVGVELQKSLADAGQLLACDRTTADLHSPERLRDLIRQVQPVAIVNAAAYTAVDRAESEADLAMTINGAAPAVLAEESARQGAWLIHYSTDYVFDGSKNSPWVETDTPAPLNVYGHTKLAGELAIERVGGRYLIFRTSWVFGAQGQNFVRTMLRMGMERNTLRIVNDQHGAPTSSTEIARATRHVLDRVLRQSGEGPAANWSGIYHMTCSGQTNWAEFAQAIFALVPPPPGRTWPTVTGIASSEYPVPARRPHNSLLDNGKLRRVFGVELAPWRQALVELFQHSNK